MPPWDKYAAPAAGAPPVGPWAKYGGDAPAAAADEIDQLAQQLAAANAPAAPGLPLAQLPQRAEPTTEVDSPWSRYVGDVAASIPDGLRQGVASIAAAPVELINAAPMLLNIPPGEQGFKPISERPVGGFKDIDEALRLGSTRSEATAPLVPDYKPQTAPGRFANRTAEEVGASLVPVAAAGAAATRLGKEGARQLPGWQRRFVEPMAVDPGRVAAREGSYAVAAGTGAQTANEVFSPDGEGTWWSDLLGSVGGTIGLGTVSTLGGAAGTMYGAARGNTQAFDDVAGAVAASRLIDNSSLMQRQYAEGGIDAVNPDVLANRLMQPSAAEQAFPGYRANVADRAQDVGLATLAYNSNTISPGAMNARITDNAGVVDQWFRSAAPEGNAPYLREALQQGADQRIAAAVDEASGATRAFDTALADIQPQRGPVDRGYSIRSALQGANDAELARIKEMYGSLDGSLPVDYAGLRQQFDAVTADLPLNDQRRFAPQELDTVRQLAPDDAESAVLPLKQALSVRSGLADTLTDPAATNQQRHVVGQYQDEMDAFIRSALPEDQVKLMDEARAARLDVGRRFEDIGAIPDILKKTGRSQYDMPNEAVPGRVTGSETDYQAVMREAGSDAAARRAVAEQIKDEAVQANVIRSPDALARFVQDRNFALKDFPEVRNALERAGASKQTMDAAEAAAKETTRQMSPGGPSATGQYLRYDDTRTRDAIKTAWNSAQPERSIRELLEVAGDTPDTRAAAKAALWEEVSETGRDSARTITGEDGTVRWNGRKLTELLNKPAFSRTADILWEDNPEHLANIREAAEALAGAEGSVRAKVPGSSGTAQSLAGKLDKSITTTSIASRARSVNRGQLSPTIAVVDVLSTALRNRSAKVQAKAIDEMLARAINEPEFAASLLRKYNPADERAMKRAFLSQYGVRLPTVANILAETDDDEDETFDRVMGGQQ